MYDIYYNFFMAPHNTLFYFGRFIFIDKIVIITLITINI